MDRASPEIVIVSGIPAGDGGTGQFIAHLRECIADGRQGHVRLLARPVRPASWQLWLWLKTGAYARLAKEVFCHARSMALFWVELFAVWTKRDIPLILLHPQNLGYRLALRLIESRTSPSLLYLLDSSFFCVASYNHVSGENGSCLRCLEYGFDQIEKNGCKPFPRPDSSALEFAPRLLTLVGEGRVSVVAQNLRQAELAKRQFGLPSLPRTIGLWTQDWNEVFAEKPWLSPRPHPAAYTWDVLFHGHCLDAKGAAWVAKVAAICPDLRFMLPFSRPRWFSAPANCSFVPCSWESGLRNEMAKSRFVIVPSLWSAPIEGALVKSVACAGAVMVVDNPTSFCDELPDGVVLKLPALPQAGAERLKHAYESNWRPDTGARTRWLDEFSGNKREFVSSLLHAAITASGR